MPTEKKPLEFEFYTNREFLKSLNTGRAFLEEDNTYPPPNASWQEQMSNYFRGHPPAYRADIPLQKIRWESDDQRMLVRIEEFHVETLSFQYKLKFNNWWAGIIYFFLDRPLQIFLKRPSLSIGLVVLVVSYLLHEVS